jgi:hypothetical protein
MSYGTAVGVDAQTQLQLYCLLGNPYSIILHPSISDCYILRGFILHDSFSSTCSFCYCHALLRMRTLFAKQQYDNDNSKRKSRDFYAGGSEELAESHVHKTTRLATEESESP